MEFLCREDDGTRAAQDAARPHCQGTSEQTRQGQELGGWRLLLRRLDFLPLPNVGKYKSRDAAVMTMRELGCGKLGAMVAG